MIEKFVVKHYSGTERPIIKGNKFDGLEIGNDRQEATEFVDWVNARLTELNLDVDALDPQDPLNLNYIDAIQRAQGGLHDGLPKRLRYYVMQQLAARAIAQAPGDDVVECGCWHGHSTLLIERALLHHGSQDSRLHVFDSFDGLSEFTSQDASPLVMNQYEVRMGFRSDYDTLQAKVSDHTHLHQGWIPDVFAHAPDPMFISFANIDVDLYEPTRDSLAFVYPRLVSGGIVFFDDYGYKAFPGAKLAVDQYVASHPRDLFVKLPLGGAYLVKP